MKKSPLFASIVVICLLLIQTVAAQLPASRWTWENYVGSTQWMVDVTEDETGCGGGRNTASRFVTVQHDREVADVSDFEHGRMRGAFDGNKLSIPSKMVSDGAGKSKLSAFELVFTPDCMQFSGKYTWTYKDSMMGCSGSTYLRGSRTDDNKCPSKASQREQIEAARAASAEKERLYQKILDEDPTNFWANWDMAELKKKQKKYDEFFKYFDAAAGNEKNTAQTREELKKVAARSMHLSTFPTKETSPILRYEMDELNNWQGGRIHGIDVEKEQSWSVKDLPLRIWTAYTNAPSEFMYKLAGWPSD